MSAMDVEISGLRNAEADAATPHAAAAFDEATGEAGEEMRILRRDLYEADRHATESAAEASIARRETAEARERLAEAVLSRDDSRAATERLRGQIEKEQARCLELEEGIAAAHREVADGSTEASPATLAPPEPSRPTIDVRAAAELRSRRTTSPRTQQLGLRSLPQEPVQHERLREKAATATANFRMLESAWRLRRGR